MHVLTLHAHRVIRIISSHAPVVHHMRITLTLILSSVTPLDDLLAYDPEMEAARRPKKRRHTKRQRLLEMQAQLEREADGSAQHQEQAEKLAEQVRYREKQQMGCR